jgi:hypothetical protein
MARVGRPALASTVAVAEPLGGRSEGAGADSELPSADGPALASTVAVAEPLGGRSEGAPARRRARLEPDFLRFHRGVRCNLGFRAVRAAETGSPGSEISALAADGPSATPEIDISG